MAVLANICKAGPVPVVGMGIALVLPLLVPALRPHFAVVLKAAVKGGVKLFIEAELGADDALTDALVETAVEVLTEVTARGSDEHRERMAEQEVGRFVSAARAGARRRGFNERDAAARYRKHLARFEKALTHAHQHVHPSQRAALGHAAKEVARRHEEAKRAGSGQPAHDERLESEASRIALARATGQERGPPRLVT